MDFKIEFSQLDSPVYNLIPREPKPIVYPADFDTVPVSSTIASASKIESIPTIETEENKSIQSSSNDEIEFGFEEKGNMDEEKNENTSIDIEFEDSINTQPEIINEIIADNELALDGQIEFEATQNSQLELESEEEPLILEFEDALSFETNKVAEDTLETIEFGEIPAQKAIEIEPKTLESIEERQEPENGVGNETDSTNLFEDERHRAKILTAIKMRDLNFDAQKITDITGISLKEMNDFEAYSRLNEEKENEEINTINETSTIIEKAEDTYQNTDNKTITNNTPHNFAEYELDLKKDEEIKPLSTDFTEDYNKKSTTNAFINIIQENSIAELEPKIESVVDTETNNAKKMETPTPIQTDLEDNNSDKLPFTLWLDKFKNPSESSIEEKEIEENKEDNTSNISKKMNPTAVEIQNDFEFESSRYVLDEGEFNEPIKNYIQEQIETKKTKINPEESYKPKSIETIDFNEIVSETLAKLYIKQGHKEKGIHMYEKLILKFPEKSVYFASEIEKLK